MRVASVVLAAALLSGTAAADSPHVLRAGVPARDAIGGNAPVRFRIEVPAGAAVRVRVRHQGIYCVLRLLENGARIDHSDDANGESGEELLAAPILDINASYEVEIEPIVHDACGSYEAVVEQGLADEHARLIAEAHRRYFEARQLESAGDAKSLAGSLRKFDEAIDLAESAGEPLTEGEALLRSAIVFGQVSRIAEGIERASRAILHLHSLGFEGAEGRAIDRRGELARRIGDVISAEQDLKAALPLVTAARDYEGIFDVHNNLGLLYEQNGRWDDAIALFEAVLPLSSRVALDTASALQANLGNTYSDMGDYRRALPPLERSLALKRQLNNPRRISQTLHAIALVQIAMGDLGTAQKTLKETLALAELSGDPQIIGNTDGTLGRVHLQQREVDAAVASFTKALEMLRKAKDRRAEARVLTSLARAELDRGRLAQATELASLALTGARDSADRGNEAAALYLRALVLRNSGRIDEALADAESAVEVVESMREAIVNPDLRTTYLSTVRKYFDLVIELLMAKHQRNPAGGFAAEAFRANERSRARTLLESLARSQADVVKGVPPELLTRERSVHRQLEAKQSYLAQLLRGDRKQPAIAATEQTIGALLSEYRMLLTQIRAASPEYAALEFPEPLPLSDIQSRLLDAGTILLEYHLGAERSYVWVISSHHVVVDVLPGEARIEKLAKAWHELLRQNPSALDAGAAQKLRTRTDKAGTALAAAIIHPVASAIKGKRLIVIADGALHYIPFAALPDAEHRPLVVTHEVTNLPSATLLDTLRRVPRRRELTSVAVFADPVFQRNDPRFGKGAAAAATPADTRSEERWARFGDFHRLRFSRKEADAILATADRTTSLEALDFRASKQALMATDLRRFGIIHIATHGMVNAEEPDLSGLVFSMFDQRGKKIDGFLRLHDVYNLDLQADLVVLSACQTALGKVVYGEGLISLTRGFMYGGAKRVMATVWSVDDRAAARLMAKLYESMLSGGAPPARALREAQTAMLRDPRWSDPYYWAAFTLEGDWR